MYVSELVRFRYWTYHQYVPDPCKQTGFAISNLLATVSPACLRNGVSLPGWRKKIAMKQSATTGYQRTVTKVHVMDPAEIYTPVVNSSCSATNWSVRKNEVFTTHIPVNALTAFPAIAADSVLEDQALAKIRSRINDYDSMYNAFVPLGELRELHGLIRGMAQSGLKLGGLIALMLNRVHSRKTLLHTARLASDTWLTWNFGLSPMVSDIKSVCESIALATTNLPSHRENAKASKVFRSSSSTENGGSHPLPALTIQRSFISEQTTGFFAGLSPVVKSANDYAAYSNALGINAGNLVPAIWELIPYSWLIDYFTNAGDVIEDTFELERSLIYSGTARRLYTVQECSVKKVASGQLRYPGKFVASCMQYVRASSGRELPRRQLRFKTIDEIGRNAVSKVANLFSLLGSRNLSYAKRYL